MITSEKDRISVATRKTTGSARILISSKGLLLLCLMYLIFYVDRVNISAAAPLIKHDLGLSNTALGFAFSAFAYPYALFQLIGGWLGDRFGPRWTLGVSGLIVCISTALTGAVGGLAALVAVRLALGFGEGAAFPTATRVMATWLPASRWGFAQGVTHSASRIGNALTPPLIAWLITVLSWRGSFVVLGAAGLIWTAVWVWLFRDDPRTHPKMTAAELEGLPRSRSRAVRPKVPWLRLVPRILPVTAVDFCYGWTLWLFLSWIPSFFFHNFHLNLAHSALFSSGVFLSGVVGDTLGGIVSDRILKLTGNLRRARCGVIAGGLFGGFLFMIPVVLVHDLAVVAVCLSLAFFCIELVVAPIWAVPMDIAPTYAGSASGIMNFGFGIAGIISPFVFGYVIDVTGSWTVPFLASIGLLLVGAALALRLRPDQPLIEQNQSSIEFPLPRPQLTVHDAPAANATFSVYESALGFREILHELAVSIARTFNLAFSHDRPLAYFYADDADAIRDDWRRVEQDVTEALKRLDQIPQLAQEGPPAP